MKTGKKHSCAPGVRVGKGGRGGGKKSDDINDFEFTNTDRWTGGQSVSSQSVNQRGRWGYC